MAVVSDRVAKDEQKYHKSIFSPPLSGKKTFRIQPLPVKENNTALKIPHWKCAGGECNHCGTSKRFGFQCGIEYDKFSDVEVWL